jgi:hypothetical protein
MSADQLGVHVSVRMWKPGQLSEDPLDDVKDVLDPRADTRLGMIDLVSATGETSGASCSLLREILSHLKSLFESDETVDYNQGWLRASRHH